MSHNYSYSQIDPNKKFYQILNGRNLLHDQMEYLNEVWDTLKEIAAIKMKQIFDGHKDNKGRLNYGRFETLFQIMF